MAQGDITGAGRKPRRRNPQATTRDILVAARDEFVEFGLDGARVDRIAVRANANKRLIYAYVGNKDQLYAKVLLDAYHDIRAGECQLDLGNLPPVEAMARLVGSPFDRPCCANSGWDSLRESNVVADRDEHTRENGLQDHELA